MTKKTKFEGHDLQVYRGDNEVYTFTVYQSTTSSTVIDLVGYTVTCFIRETPQSPVTLAEISISDGGGSDFTNGVIQLTIPKATTRTLPRKCYYDIQAESGALTSKTVIRGEITVFQDVTR